MLEIRYHAQPVTAASYSLTVFYNVYDKLRTQEPNPAGVGSVFNNNAQGTTRGIEMQGSWRATDARRLSGGLVAQRSDTRLMPDSAAASSSTGLASNDPSHYRMLRSSYDISKTKQLDFSARRVEALPRPPVPPYASLDLRSGWEPRPDPAFSVVAQNLLNSSHAEFGAAPARSESDRGLLLTMLWRFPS